MSSLGGLRGYLGMRVDAAEREVPEHDQAIAARVERDIQSGDRSGVEGTPTLFIDGIVYLGPRDPASLREALR